MLFTSDRLYLVHMASVYSQGARLDHGACYGAAHGADVSSKKVAHGDEDVCRGMVIVVSSSNVFARRLLVLVGTLS